MVALFLDDYTLSTEAMKPSIAIITSIVSEREISIEYYKGGWTSIWKPWLIRGKPWADKIPTSAIVLYNFTLDNGKLTKPQRDAIKEAYTDRGK